MISGTPGFDSDEITRLRREIDSAWGAFDAIDEMTWEHRVLVVRYVVGALPDAANAAARAGWGEAALSLLHDALAFPPPWAGICTKWEHALRVSIEAVECVAWPEGWPLVGASGAAGDQGLTSRVA
ncbi:hypothetical protein ABID92_002439 [Frigoribacterium sp. PvP120]|uniref:hypothetical protein n=1 Tax=unclassified Frigoribacterium TaxID=2627005 RepID=UPI001AE4073C|nr:hypothetical protein [Frigoribacterium sp. PvP121]MBP1242267.1 hypothetical protein [Frigoribacterium sp. PvP121]